MAALVKRHGRKLRPHVKAHKSPDIARQPDRGRCRRPVLRDRARGRGHGGGAGSTASSSPRPWSTPGMIARLVWRRASRRDFAVVVDSVAGVERAGGAGRGVTADRRPGRNRHGPDADRRHRRRRRRARSRAGSASAAARLSRRAGLLRPPAARADARRAAREGRREAGRGCRGFLEALAGAGLPAEIVSGGGTGTHLLDLEGGPFTELQAGSYVFMDKQYGAVELAPGGAPVPDLADRRGPGGQHRPAGPGDRRCRAQGDGDRCRAGRWSPAGAPPRRPISSWATSTARCASPRAPARPALGDLVTLVAPHCDPTVNLHDRFHVVRRRQAGRHLADRGARLLGPEPMKNWVGPS